MYFVQKMMKQEQRYTWKALKQKKDKKVTLSV